MENDVIKLCEEYKKNNNLSELELMALDLIITILKMDELMKKEIETEC